MRGSPLLHDLWLYLIHCGTSGFSLPAPVVANGWSLVGAVDSQTRWSHLSTVSDGSTGQVGRSPSPPEQNSRGKKACAKRDKKREQKKQQGPDNSCRSLHFLMILRFRPWRCSPCAARELVCWWPCVHVEAFTTGVINAQIRNPWIRLEWRNPKVGVLQNLFHTRLAYWGSSFVGGPSLFATLSRTTLHHATCVNRCS